MTVHLVSAPSAGFHARTQGWESRAGGSTVLRGRRCESHGPTIHFLSGNGFCGGTYWPFLRELTADYGLFTHDIEGHGDSEAPAKFSGIEAVCRRVIAVANEQRLGRPLIGMGHSFGAALTLKLAAENPTRFSALVLLDPIIMPPTAWHIWSRLRYLRANPAAQTARKRRDRWRSRDEAAERLHGRGIYAGWTAEAFDSFIDHATRDDANGERVLNCPKEIEAQIFERPVYPWNYFSRLSIPVLVVYGAQTYSFIAPATKLAQKHHPRLQAQTLPGGHCFMQQDPMAAAQTVRAFLGKVG